jgi:hypothetical protein
MPQERLTLRQIRPILLKEESDLYNRGITQTCNISNITVGESLSRVAVENLPWQLLPGSA